jgi:hypothetical protein
MFVDSAVFDPRDEIDPRFHSMLDRHDAISFIGYTESITL